MNELADLRNQVRDLNRKLQSGQVKLEAEKITTRELRKERDVHEARVLELTREVGVLTSRVEHLPVVEQELEQTRQQLLEVLQRREADIKEAVKEATVAFEAERSRLLEERALLVGEKDALLAERDQLLDQVSKRAVEATTATPQDLAGHFALVIEDLQAEATARTDRPVVSTIRSFEVELKGIVQADEETKTTRVILPAAGEVDPNQLSTLRMSFATIPRLRRPPPPGEEEPPS